MPALVEGKSHMKKLLCGVAALVLVGAFGVASVSAADWKDATFQFPAGGCFPEAEKEKVTTVEEFVRVTGGEIEFTFDDGNVVVRSADNNSVGYHAEGMKVRLCATDGGGTVVAVQKQAAQ